MQGRNPILLVNGTNLWDNANEYCGTSGHEYSVYQLSEAADLTSTFQAAGASCQVAAGQQECVFGTRRLRSIPSRFGIWLTVRGPCFWPTSVGPTNTDNRVRGLIADQVTAYFRLPSSIPEPIGSISGRFVEPARVDGSLFRVSQDRMNVLRRGRGWELLSFQSSGTFDALSSAVKFRPRFTIRWCRL